MLDLDRAPEDYLAFERDIKKRGIRWVTSRDDAQRMRALSAGWMQGYRPAFVKAMGEVDQVAQVDEDITWLRSRAGVRTDSSELRERLRRIARTISRELLPAYDANRWSFAANIADHSDDEPILRRLTSLDEAIARSYKQALLDLDDPNRFTYVGPATELREVLGATIRRLSPPDGEIASRSWFKGHQGKPPQAERIRAILSDKARYAPAIKTFDMINETIGSVARSTYNRASAATHLGRSADRADVSRLRPWVDAVLGEILPDAG